MLAWLFLRANGKNVAPRGLDFVSYELELGAPDEPWRNRGWEPDEADEWVTD